MVTGANKGIGFEICRQLASEGVIVILTARSEKRGIEAQEKLKELGVSDNVVFHQLDVLDPVSVATIVEFVKTRFGRLDILVRTKIRKHVSFYLDIWYMKYVHFIAKLEGILGSYAGEQCRYFWNRVGRRCFDSSTDNGGGRILDFHW